MDQLLCVLFKSPVLIELLSNHNTTNRESHLFLLHLQLIIPLEGAG